MLLLLALACGPSSSSDPTVPVVNDPRRVPDVNGDGLGDVIAPVRDPDGAGGERAHVAVWLGPADGPPLLVPVDETPSLPSYATFVGDVDGDGFSDLVYSEHGATASPVALLMPGSADGPVPDAGVRLEDPGTDSSGALVHRVGDLDGDGLDDVIVQRAWTLSVHHAAGGIGGAPDAVWQDGAMPDWYTPMGDSWRGQRIGEVLALGDVTGDGRDDVLAWWYALVDSDNTFVESWAYVIPGPADGATPWIPANEVFPALYSNHNARVYSLGDVDGDGLIDLSVADPNGAVAWSTQGWAREDGLVSVDDAGADLNADGFGDVVVRANLVVNVHTGSAEGLTEEPAFSFPLPSSPAAPSVTPENLEAWRYGLWGGGVGDVDGDGFDDTVVGTDVDLWLWHGGPGGGREGDPGTQLITNYLEPLGLARRAEAP